MEQIQLDIQPKDTLKLQLSSVIQFMEQLQYEWMACSKCFESGHPVNKGRSILRLQTAIELHNGVHNGVHTEWHGKYFDTPFENIPVIWVLAAVNKKIVTSVSLQHSWKRGIICQKMWVRFAQTSSGELFKVKYLGG